jgi:hypothetical protein
LRHGSTTSSQHKNVNGHVTPRIIERHGQVNEEDPATLGVAEATTRPSPLLQVISAEVSTLLLDTIRQLSAARRERDVWCLIARSAIHHAHDQHVTLERQQRGLDELRNELRRYVRRQMEAAQ